jgi:hypothetical protein
MWRPGPAPATSPDARRVGGFDQAAASGDRWGCLDNHLDRHARHWRAMFHANCRAGSFAPSRNVVRVSTALLAYGEPSCSSSSSSRSSCSS